MNTAIIRLQDPTVNADGSLGWAVLSNEDSSAFLYEGIRRSKSYN